MYACFGFIYLPHTESTRSRTLCELSQRRVRLHVNWVNAEWDSTLTESVWSETPRQLSQRRRPNIYEDLSFCIDSVDVESHLALTQLTRNETPRQLSTAEC